MKLNYKDYGSGSPLVILHGLFGSSDNWSSLAKAFSDSHHVYLVDARNHGRSPHTDTHSYAEMAADLYGFFLEHRLKDAILIGHSMGGKTAMEFAAGHPELLRRLVVVDMGVRYYPLSRDIRTIIRFLQSLDLSRITSRKDAEEFLNGMLEDSSTVQFLLKSMYRQKQGDGTMRYAWRFNLDVLEHDIGEMGMANISGADIPTLFLYGTKSDHLTETDMPEIRRIFPKAEFISLDTGHWVHADDPRGFVTAVRSFIG